MYDSKVQREKGRRAHRGWLAAAAGVGLAAVAMSACSVTGLPTKSAGGADPAPAPTAPATTVSAPTTTPITTATSVAATTVPTAVTPTTAAPTAPAPPHFDTPEQAMVYLASAWNRDDTTELMHVTSPIGRQALDSMSKELVNLQLDHCTENAGAGDYTCFFDHDPLPGAVDGQPGARQAQFIVAPALTPGWYMTVVQVCG